MSHGTLYLIPVPLGESALNAVLPGDVQRRVECLDTFIVEQPKSARAFLKQIDTRMPLQQLTLLVLNEHTSDQDLPALITPLLAGKDVGLISEAGCPAVADPGARLVRLAHSQQIRVVPLVGPSSILLALMASGLSGQRFCFHGYLPVDKAARATKLKELEYTARAQDQTQIFIETPYRNVRLLEAILEVCGGETLLCIAIELTTPAELILTKPVREWRRNLPALDKRPSVFLLYPPGA